MRDGGESLELAAPASAPAAESALRDPALAAPTYTNRFEIKYLVETERLPEIHAATAGFFRSDVNSDADGGYFVYSIYFDSPHCRFYDEKREGQLVRIKPRIRQYRSSRDSKPTGIFLELKGRYDRIVSKRRVPIDAALAERLLSPGSPDYTARELENSVIGEFAYLQSRYMLAPSVTVMYRRTAFNGAFYPGLRMTFDRTIQASLATTMRNADCAFAYAVPPSFSIVELKYNERISRLLLDRLNVLGLRQGTLSKYAMAMEETYETFRRAFGAS